MDNSAKAAIQQLKNGYMLVALHEKSLAINACKKKGFNGMANKIKLAQQQENKSIANAFLAEFNFTKVYFFSDTNAQEVLKHPSQWILNRDLNPVKSTDFTDSSFFLIAEFGRLSGNESGFEALRIIDKHFNEMQRPFPFYVRSNKWLIVKRKHQEVVKALNEELVKFYKLNNQQR